MFLRGLDQIVKREAGWQSAALVSGKIALPQNLSSDPDRSFRFYRALRDRLAALPGADGATVDLELCGLASALPELAADNVTAVAGASVLLLTVAVGACYLPARRAAKVDPLVAIRAD